MPVGSGIAGQYGCVPEVSYGTTLAPNHFYRVTKAQQKRVNNTALGGGISAGQIAIEQGQRVLVSTGATGDIEMPFSTSSMGLWLDHLFGTTTVPAQQAATIAYLQTRANIVDNVGKSLTSQVGVPLRGGTVSPYTMLGSKITAATFTCSAGGLLTMALTLDGKELVKTTALAAASYGAGQLPFHFGDLAVKLGAFNAEALVQGVKAVTLTFTRPQSTDDSYYAGNANATGVSTKSEPIWNDFMQISGSIDIDVITEADFVDRFATNTPTSMLLSWTKTTPIAAANFPSISFQLPATFFDGDSPDLEDTGVTAVTIPFSCQVDLTNGFCKSLYMSTDITI